MERHVVILGFSDAGSGAHHAGLRIHRAILKYGASWGIRSTLCVVKSTSQQPSILAGYPALPLPRRLRRSMGLLTRRVKKALYRLLGGVRLHSRANVRTGIAQKVHDLKPDFVVVNWIGDYTLSVSELKKLPRPVFLRNGDEWFFSGSQHFSVDRRLSNLKDVFQNFLESLFFGRENQSLLATKIKDFPGLVDGVISPSASMMSASKSSRVLEGVPHFVIENPVDSDFWKPKDKTRSREQLGIPLEKLIVGFGAALAFDDPRKGGDILLAAVSYLQQQFPERLQEIEIHWFGDGRKPGGRVYRDLLTGHGKLKDSELRDFYSAVDLMVVPSRKEGFSNVAAEAQSCGCPVVASDIGGLQEVVQEGLTGYLVPVGDFEHLAKKLIEAVSDRELIRNLGKNARLKVVNEFSESAFVRKIHELMSEF